MPAPYSSKDRHQSALPTLQAKQLRKLGRQFSQQVLDWFDRAGRKHLPWQQNKTPYRVWLSEIMLQQTQVTTVIPYFERFLKRYPTVNHLAQAKDDDVMELWAGLGYYNRARNLLKCARIVSNDLAGEFPLSVDELEKLPGIGRSTAGAILSLSLNQRAAILDGNVKRVLARVFCIEGWYGAGAVAKQLWALSEQLTPKQRCGDYNQAMMDLGATVCKRTAPECANCPLNTMCEAYRQQRTSELPTRKPRKNLAERDFHFLLTRNAKEELLLEKRPPSGVWGGLWCLPTISPNVVKKNARPVSKFSHLLTHFKMQIHIWDQQALRKAAGHQVEEASGLLWHNKQSLRKLGLPTPIRSFLQADE